MILKQLTLTNYKNIAEANLAFSAKINCFVGNNGMGKSNLLDAIYYMSFTRSFTRVTDRMLLRRGESFTMAKALYRRRDTDEEITFGLADGRRKSFKRGGKEYDRLSAHIGLFPLVMVAPDDVDLIKGAGEERRAWMDIVISQSDTRYLDHLIRYNRALEQRNSLLRNGVVDHTLYEAIELALEASATYIYNVRKDWVERLSEIFNRYYHAVAGNDEDVALHYSSSLSRPGVTLGTLLDQARYHDEMVKHTSVGIHRDDIEMTLEGMNVRRTGSQGQCKTVTIALKLAQYEFLREAAGLKPLLLLDDIFDKLDATRVERIIELIAGEDFGQIFITDTNRTHLDEIMARTGGDYRLWLVENGNFTPLHAHETN